MHSCHFKEKKGNKFVCGLCRVDSFLLLGKTYRECVGEDNCILFQINDMLVSLEAEPVK
jgi:hypothetical protein